MASKTLLSLLAIALVFSLATAFFEDEDEDLGMMALEDEFEKRGMDIYDDLLDMDKKSYPKCRHWFSKALCRCNYRFGRYDERRYYCASRQRGTNHSPFG